MLDQIILLRQSEFKLPCSICSFPCSKISLEKERGTLKSSQSNDHSLLQTTFSYNSDLWTNKVPLNQSSGKSGFDHDETKMPSFWSTPFTKLCLGMLAAGQETNWITVSYQASSLHSLTSTNTHYPTNVGRGRWKSLLADSSLQRNCNMEGFNVKPSSRQNHHAVTRIGILGNNQDDCRSCNSRIGFGSEGSSHGQQDVNSCGNESAERGNDNGEKRIKANCFILLQQATLEEGKIRF